MQRDELAAWLHLALNPGIGPAAARKLLAAFGLPHQVLAQDVAALAQVVDHRRAEALHRAVPGQDDLLEATLQWLAQAPGQREVLTLADPAYPAALLQTADPPLMLYRMGRLAPFPRRALSVVGSRNPTPQGLQNARRFARAFAEADVTVVSGLALGIDGAAHQGALDGAGPEAVATIAVVGTGLDRVYPKQHLELAHAIAARGMIVSEFPIGTPPLPPNFPQRNRILAALGQGTLVVEAALQSGSLITARFAAEMGREVFAIPGSIHSPHARGCHALLRQGAKLVETAQDVLEDLRLVLPAPAAPSPREQPKGEDPLLEALGYDPMGLDALIARTGIPAANLQARLLELELAGEVARLPGGLYQRIGRA